MRTHSHVPPAAIAMIAVSVLCFTVLDSIVKSMAHLYPVPVLVWARYVVQMIALLIWLGPRMGRSLLHTKRPGLQLVRAGLLPFSSVFFVSSLKYLPLAEATAINYSTPVIVVILAVVFLHERMTQARIALVIAGIAGMFLIVRPGSAMFQGAALFALAAAACYAVFQILTRKLAAEDWRALLFYPALVGTLMMTAVMPWYAGGIDAPWTDWALVVVGGLMGTLGHFLFILAFQRGPASALTPYTYVHLVWATLSGWLVFRSFPDVWTLAGMAVITGSGLLIALHERRRSRGAPQEPPGIE
jgi:drug/metabolite transporter (DMT)-like permease